MADLFNNLIEEEIEERSNFASIFATKLKTNPKTVEILTGISFEKFARILLIDCDLDLDFITISQLHDHFKE